jgi:hypothetical protein
MNELETSINGFAAKEGFTVRREHSRKFEDELVYCTWLCSASGKFVSQDKGMRQTKSVKTDCKFKVYTLELHFVALRTTDL